MGKVGGIALQGSSWGLTPPLLLSFLFYTMTSGLPANAADGPPACQQSIARVVSIQGPVEVQRARQADWSAITRLDTVLCDGDRLRTGPQSRAALFLQPETLVRVDQNTSVVLGQTADETLVEFTQEDVVPVSTSAHTCGAGYFITRFPRKFKVRTPFLNAAVEGTEFLVAMRCESTELSVFEGKVLAESAGSNVFPSQSVVTGQTLTVGGSGPPAVKLQLKPADAVQWTLYYPPITPAGTVPAEDCRVVPQDNRLSCLIARAEQLLRAGRVEEAQANIGDALASAPYSSDAKALSSIISLARNDKAEALRLAKEAVEATPNSAPAWLALSYAQQADFKLEAALTSAQRAAELTPSSALALARVAELQLSLGWTREAEKTAQQAVAANPSESRAHMILGFVHLAQINVKEAREDFERAIELDSTDPLSRLGLGLAIIRKGKLNEAREQIEIAVALDPTNSLVRSYVGKTYYEENTKERDHLASTQFGIAKALDPKDPTPWFYDALLKDSQTRPAEALHDLEKATELNENRAVYRSRLFLDQDLAARNASTASTYIELGFSQLGLAKAAQSLAFDPADASAHRLLADIYTTLPRHEIARASELLQAQLRQPLGAPPLQPQLANDILFKSRFSGSASVGLNEFNSLFMRDHLELQLFGLAGEHSTYGEQAILNGLSGPISFSLSQFSANSEGYRINNDDTQRQYDGFLQAQLTTDTSVQFEATRTTRQTGDMQSSFDPNFFLDGLRTDEQLDTYRFGIRHIVNPGSDILFSFIQQDRNASLNIPDPLFPFFANSEQDSWKAEAQYLTKQDLLDVILGASYFEASSVEETTFDTVRSEPFHINSYAYLYSQSGTRFPQVQVGVSYDHLRSRDAGDETQFNPKFGVIWRVSNSVTLRAAAFRVLKRRINSDQGLEPTQVAGFNQYYDDANGTSSNVGGAAIDLALSQTVSTGLQYEERRLDVPFTLFTGEIEFQKQTEQLVSAYLYWLPNSRMSLSLEPRYQHLVGGGLFDLIQLWELPVSARFFFTSGLWAGATVRRVWESGRFVGPGGIFFEGSDSFYLLDAMLAYRLPGRKGTVSFEGTNLFDKSFKFQEIDLVSAPRYVPQRQLFLRVSLDF